MSKKNVKPSAQRIGEAISMFLGPALIDNLESGQNKKIPFDKGA